MRLFTYQCGKHYIFQLTHTPKNDKLSVKTLESNGQDYVQWVCKTSYHFARTYKMFCFDYINQSEFYYSLGFYLIRMWLLITFEDRNLTTKGQSVK